MKEMIIIDFKDVKCAKYKIKISSRGQKYVETTCDINNKDVMNKIMQNIPTDLAKKQIGGENNDRRT